MTTAHGAPTGTATDAQHQRAELDRLREENRTLVRLNRLQGRFVAMASHEFKTPLTSITAYTDALLAETDQSDRTRDFLGVVRDEAARLLRMINRILDFSRLEYGSRLLQREPVDLADLARETVHGFGATLDARGQRAEVIAALDLPPAMADADLMRQVLVNLVGNAVKYAPDGGHVRLTVREDAATMAVEVADDGPGIPASDLQRVFAEFYRSAGTVEVEGTGLGLSVVRHIVHLHGGYVNVRRRRQGTAFTIHLPKQVVVPHCDDRPEDSLCAPVLRNTLRLLADFTGARTAVLLLREESGTAKPAAHMGLPLGIRLDPNLPLPARGAEDPMTWLATLALPGGDVVIRDSWLVVPVAADGHERGWALLGHPGLGRSYGPRDRDQACVLGRLAARALAASEQEPGPALEALRVLLRIRWRGVPTATAEALDLAASLGRSLGMPPVQVAHLQDAVTLHDAGMDRVEDEILLGQGELRPEDREEIDRHVALGMDLLAPLLTDAITAHIIRHHHERWDGGGHPDGLRGAEIPQEARTLAVIDAWFSLIRGRPGREGMSPDRAMAEIRSSTGSQFDPGVVAELARLVATCPDAPSRPEPGPAPAGA